MYVDLFLALHTFRIVPYFSLLLFEPPLAVLRLKSGFMLRDHSWRLSGTKCSYGDHAQDCHVQGKCLLAVLYLLSLLCLNRFFEVDIQQCSVDHKVSEIKCGVGSWKDRARIGHLPCTWLTQELDSQSPLWSPKAKNDFLEHS